MEDPELGRQAGVADEEDDWVGKSYPQFYFNNYL
jgi:hypothetical protein